MHILAVPKMATCTGKSAEFDPHFSPVTLIQLFNAITVHLTLFSLLGEAEKRPQIRTEKTGLVQNLVM